MDRTAQFYSMPSYGSGMPVFAGSRRQRGGGILGSLKNFFMPLFTSLSRKRARTAMNVAQNVVGVAISGKSIPSSLRKHGLTAAKRFGNQVLASALGQVSTSIGRKTGAKQKPAAKRKPGPSRKRAAPRKAKQTAKRVKTNF